jgi:hypothetical protein
MVKFILRTLLGVPAWLLYFALMLPLIVIGFPLVAVLALVKQLQFKYTSHTRTSPQLRFPTLFGLRLFYLWENDEDGIDGDPWTEASGEPKNPEWFEATASWSIWRKVFVWSAWRNSVGNARRVPFFGMTMTDPKDTVVVLPMTWKMGVPVAINRPWDEYRKLGPYLVRYGYRFELKFPWTATRYFWIGWRIAQQDQPNTDIGFAFQPWARL